VTGAKSIRERRVPAIRCVAREVDLHERVKREDQGSPDHGGESSMPTRFLKVKRLRPSDVDHLSPELVRPLFRGNGDTDYQCGNCGSVIGASMGPTQRHCRRGHVLPVRGRKRVPGSLTSMTLVPDSHPTRVSRRGSPASELGAVPKLGSRGRGN
jgi:hypothetical protein